jgi:transcriptional regulator with XRE-family HTH domain
MDMSKGEKDGGGGARAIPVPAPEAMHRNVPAIVGSNLKRLRKARGFSLERLAELSGVSRAMLGQIETGKSVPTVSLLWKVADALKVSVATLMATDNGAAAVVLPGAHPVHSASNGLFTRRPLFPLDRFIGAGFFELRIAPLHRETVEGLSTGAQVNLVLVQGSLSIAVGEKSPITLVNGDAILFDADVAHAYENLGKSEVVAYLVESHCARNAT